MCNFEQLTSSTWAYMIIYVHTGLLSVYITNTAYLHSDTWIVILCTMTEWPLCSDLIRQQRFDNVGYSIHDIRHTGNTYLDYIHTHNCVFTQNAFMIIWKILYKCIIALLTQIFLCQFNITLFSVFIDIWNVCKKRISH